VEAKSRLLGKLEGKLPTIRPDYDLFVFLAELKDVKSVWDATLVRLGKLLKLSHRVVRASTLVDVLLKGVRNSDKPLKYMANRGGSEYLMYHFALKPLVTDLVKIIATLFDWRDRVKAVEEGLGKVHDLTTSIPEYYFDISETSDNLKWPGHCAVGACFEPSIEGKVKHKLSATIKYRYVMPKTLWGPLDSIEQFLTAIGVAPTVESFWNLVPFSFVLYLFLNTDNLLKGGGLVSLDANDVQVEILDFCLVLKEFESTRLISPWCHSDNGIADQLDIKRFVRWTGEDALEQLSWWVKPPSFMAVSLGAALVSANLRV
jgi:hypothetical protein